MKKTLLVVISLVFLLGLFSNLIADTTITVGTGTSATGTTAAAPINVYYNSLHGQFVLTKTELNAAGMTGAQRITQFSFYVASLPTASMPNFKIRMKHTTQANAASHIAGPYTVVYSATSYMPAATGYSLITLTSPFDWNGTDNILIDTAFSVLSPTGSGGTVRYTTLTSGFRYVRSDTVDQTDVATTTTSTYKPNVQLAFTAIPAVAPGVAVNPSPVDTATGQTNTTQLSWAAGGGGGLPTDYDVYFGTSPSPGYIGNQVATTYNPGTLDYSQTYYWKIIPHNLQGYATGCPTWSFTVMADPNWITLPRSESFDGTTFPPAAWTNQRVVGSASPGTWARVTAGTYPTCAPRSGAGMAYYNCFNISANTEAVLSTPPIIVPTDNYRVSFWLYRDASSSYGLPKFFVEGVQAWFGTSPTDTTLCAKIGYVPRDVVFAPVVATPGWYKYAFNFPAGSAGSGKYVILKARSVYGDNIFIDDVTVEEQPLVPNPATAVSPLPGAVDVLPTATLNWVAGSGYAPTGYNLYFGTTTPPTLVGDQGTNTTYTPTLSYTQTCYWRVVPYNLDGDAIFADCPIWSFQTRTVPPAATGPSPYNTETNVALTKVLGWTAVTGATSYDVYLGIGSVPGTVTANVLTNSYTPDLPLIAASNYFWKVVPKNEAGETASPSTWSFTTQAPPVAAATPSPANAASDVQRNVTLGWGTVSGATSYDVYIGTTLPGTVTANVLINSYKPAMLDASTPYEWKVVPKNSAGEATGCLTWTFTTGTNIVYAASAATNTIDDDIGNVTVADINNGVGTPLLSNSLSNKLYTDFTSVVGHVQQTNTYPISVTQINSGSFYACWVKVFIDFNIDGDFDDAGEQIFSAATSSTVNPVTGNITIPETATLGSTRMRVVLRESGSEVTTLPTGTYTYGETEDYTVEIAEANNYPALPTTPSPTNSAVGVSREANISWINGARTENVEVRFGITNPPVRPVYTGTAITSLTNAELDGPFIYGQTYYWQIVESNNFERVATEGPIWSFTTMSDPNIYPPYLQDFETCVVPALPNGWTIANVNADTKVWQTVTSGGHNGVKCMQISYNSSLAMDDWFFIGPINVTAGINLGVRFFYKAASETYPERMEVKIGETGDVGGMATQIWNNDNINNTVYVEGICTDVPITASGQRYLGFHGYSLEDMYNLYVDDISIITSGNGVAQVFGELPTTVYVEPIVLGGYNLVPGAVFDPPIGNVISSFFDVYMEWFTPTPGISNPGLIYSCDVSNPAILTGLTVAMSYNGLDYTPAALYYKTGGSWITPSGVVWDLMAKTATFTIASKGTRAGELIVVFSGPDDELPVELTSFTATLTAEYFVNLAWTSQSETNHLGYNLLRNNEAVMEEAITINTDIISDGVHSGTMTDYTYTDDEVDNEITYYYWLESVDLNGTTRFFGPLTVLVSNPENPDTPPVVPVVTRLCNAYPNPFNPQTIISYDLKTASDVKIEVFNVKGQHIKTLVDTHRNVGHYTVAWNGTDDSGNNVGSGVYFYRMDAGKYHRTQKVVMMK